MDLAEEEVWARDCLREALPGCAVDQYDDNSEVSMYDLTITYPVGCQKYAWPVTCSDAPRVSGRP